MSCACTGACRVPPYSCGGYVQPMGWGPPIQPNWGIPIEMRDYVQESEHAHLTEQVRVLKTRVYQLEQIVKNMERTIRSIPGAHNYVNLDH
jgi:hypothetical protein